MKIFYSNPWSNTKNMGGAINDFCRLIPNPTDWIVIQDGDICYLTPDWGDRIEAALRVDGDSFGLVGCYTNRLRLPIQLHGGRLSKDMDINNHYQIALKYKDPGILGLARNVNIAGFFMCFRKDVWEKVGGFLEDSPLFDTDFSMKVRRHGYDVGLIRALYVFHAYRPWATDPTMDTRHLY